MFINAAVCSRQVVTAHKLSGSLTKRVKDPFLPLGRGNLIHKDKVTFTVY